MRFRGTNGWGAGDIKLLKLGTFQACKEACVGYTGCIAVTWYKNKLQRCELYDNNHGSLRTWNNRISAYLSCFKDKGNVQYFMF